MNIGIYGCAQLAGRSGKTSTHFAEAKVTESAGPSRAIELLNLTNLPLECLDV